MNLLPRRYPMFKNNSELADIFCKYGKAYIQSHTMPLEHYKIMNDIVICRTAALGGHVEACDSCGKIQNSYKNNIKKVIRP